MFRNGLIQGVVFKTLDRYCDARGWLIELFREDEMAAADRPRMSYVSETLPGVARGPHEHVEQSDYFAFTGPGDFKLYLWDARTASPTYRCRHVASVGESNRQAVLIPPGVVHAYKNVSDRPGWVINCPNRLYRGEAKREAVDEIRHEDVEGSPYVLD
jgi:dTDP-4-dehydrorhamnose 3,5-epimerase